MKKFFIIIFALYLNNFVFSGDNRRLIFSQSVEYKNIPSVIESEQRKNFITFDEMGQDIDALLYYLQTSYIGYDIFVEKGFNPDNLRIYFEELYITQPQINIRDFYKKLSDYLRPYPEDGHFCIEKNSGKEFDNLFKENNVYFSNVYVKRDDSYFFVVDNGGENISLGKMYTGDKDNLFYYPSKGINIYRLGIISKNDINCFDFSFENIKQKVGVSAEKHFFSSTLIKYHEIETKNTGYASLSSFVLPEQKSMYRKGAEIVFEKFANLGITWRDKKNVIIDLRSNLGGRAYIANGFIYSLFKESGKVNLIRDEKRIDKWFNKKMVRRRELESPGYFQSKVSYLQSTGEQSKYYYKKICKELKKQKENPQIKFFENIKINLRDKQKGFDGKLLIIVDKQSASVSEDLIFNAKRFLGSDKVIVIGENTAGCCTYMDICKYVLPNSKISLQLGAQKDLLPSLSPNWHGEGIGFYPDYWTTGQDLNETIFLVTQDEEMKQKLKGIETRLK